MIQRKRTENTPIGISKIVECSAFKTLDHNDELNQKLNDAAAYFFSVHVTTFFFGNVRFQNEFGSDKEIVLAPYQLSDLITCVFNILEMLFGSSLLDNKCEYRFDIMKFVMSPCLHVVKVLSTKMGYNKVALRSGCPYSGARKGLEPPCAFVQLKKPKYIRKLKENEPDEHFNEMRRECAGYQVFFNTAFAILSDFYTFAFPNFSSPSDKETDNTFSMSNEINSESTEEYLNMMLKVIPFGQGTSLEVVPVICGLILNSCSNGLNNKLKKDDAVLTKFVKSLSLINRFWKRPASDQSKPLKSSCYKNKFEPDRIHHRKFDYSIDPVQLCVPVDDDPNSINVGFTTSGSCNQAIKPEENNDSCQQVFDVNTSENQN
ncbi:unnamed protein product [Ambrosiozyma monospora]|uniref:Unnamed protein product n=1 Tax=Ambrosiozyma monospora TaxID=43982 RepID=A0ACB5T2E4_AMBMO|nr:unnamed protein product [Ambrosiozyma monospora]